MSHPLVSIIIPSWNAAQYVKEAVDSALAQTYANIEVIVVDDGSTDDTKAILALYAHDKKIAYLYQENKGLAGARNTGIRAARGSYVAFLDSDDLFRPTKIAEQVAALESHPDYGVCYSDLIHFTDGIPRKFYHHTYRYHSGNIFAPLLWKQFVNPLAVLVRKEVVEKYGVFDETLRRSEDWDLWLRWAHAGVKFYYLDRILAEYRIRGAGNLSSRESEPQMKEKTLALFLRLGSTMTQEEWKLYRFADVLRLLRIKLLFAYLVAGDKEKAREAARELPSHWRWLIALVPAPAWKFLLGSLRRLKHRFLLQKA